MQKEISMDGTTTGDEVSVEMDVDTREQLEVPACEASKYPKLSDVDIKHNMTMLVMMDAIFVMGATELQIALGPLWKYLHASNTVIGLVGSMTIISLVGVFFAPFISLRCRIKKWFLLISHVPYLGAIGLMGLALLLSRYFGLSVAQLLTVVVVLMGAFNFFAGFVSLPHQEYVAACIPMSHRGRFSGYSSSIGSGLALASSAVGAVILLRVSRPMSFGYLFVMMWLICQSGYVLALFGKERPVPVEKAPRPWSKSMLLAAWQDKAFMRVAFLYMLYMALFLPTFTTFVGQYGLRELKMIDATAASIALIMQIVRIALGGLIGHLTDRFSPKRVVPLLPLFGCIALLPVLVLHNQLGVYITMGLTSIFLVGFYASFFALLYGIPSPENRSGHYSVQILTSNLASAVGPVVIGAMCDWTSYRATFSIVAVAALGLSLLAKHLMSPISDNAQDYA